MNTRDDSPDSDMLDVTYEIGGGPVERDYAAALQTALAQVLPWLLTEPRAGIHPLKRVTVVGSQLLLGARSRLVLRVPRDRLPDCAALQGRSLALPAPLQLGAMQVRELVPYRTLYSALVLMGEDDEGAFLEAVRTAIGAWDLACQVIVGKAGSRRSEPTGPGAEPSALRGFSLMLHGLTPEQSLRVQARGLGAARLLGCGLFTPHKSVDPVGA